MHLFFFIYGHNYVIIIVYWGMLFLWIFLFVEGMLFISVKHHIHTSDDLISFCTLLMAPQGEMPLEELMTRAAGVWHHFKIELRVRVGERARTRIIHGADVEVRKVCCCQACWQSTTATTPAPSWSSDDRNERQRRWGSRWAWSRIKTVIVSRRKFHQLQLQP
jgi:hypothetical protein